MPRRGERRTTTSRPPRPAPAPAGSVGIREVIYARSAEECRAAIDPSAFASPLLAAQLADTWVDYHRKNNLKTVHGYDRAIRSFVPFAVKIMRQWGIDPAQARLEDERIDFPEIIYRWEQDLLTKYPENSRRPWGLDRCLIALLSHWAQRAPRVPERLRRRAEAPAGLSRVTCEVLDEFTNAERLQLKGAAQAALRGLEKRLAHGRELLATGDDPREYGWQELPNLVWAARHGLLSIAGLQAQFPSHVRYWPEHLRDFLADFGAGYRGVGGLLRALHWALYPREADLHAFRILLLLAMTDCTSDEIHALRVPDLEFNAEGVRVVQAKYRADRVRADFHPAGQEKGFSPVVGELNYHGRGEWDVPGLLRRLVEAGAMTREAYATQEWLFTAVEMRHGVRMEPARATFIDPGRRLTHWIAARTGPGRPFPDGVTQPHDIRRIRKTSKTTRVVALGGTLTDLAGDDHTVQVFQRHYAHGTTAHVLAAAAMNRAQSKVFDKISGRPTLVLPTEQARLGEPEVASALGVSAEQGIELRDGVLDMGVSNCKDPLDSPHSTPGKLCHVAPAMCMTCPNAVLFVSQLPQQLLLVDHIEHMRNVLAPTTWTAVWGKQSAALASVFAELAEHIPAARAAIAEQGVNLSLPLGMRTEYDR
ncbi:hypothetical protein [Streptacidiphilus albus]|uniref:hypothetical protein n=1 Tax=Streptacidiphilus albus TaxID=105425 RepID=UPI000A5DFAAD|nr:hypothetical protein [Streptacidiphilus albus]